MPDFGGDDRQRLRQIFAFRCGYCGISEVQAGTELTEDHFHPLSKGGSHSFHNIVYACHACNSFKGAWWNPTSDSRILHPLNDDTSAHFKENNEGILVPLTSTGAFHIERLHLNRRNLVLHRVEQNRIRRCEQRLNGVEIALDSLRVSLQAIMDRGGVDN